MPIIRERYPDDWEQLALAIKEKANWRCRRCAQQCYRPGEKSKTLKRSQWTNRILCVHHSDYDPSNNKAENLIPLCVPCHLSTHTGRRGNITPGQLSLWEGGYCLSPHNPS